MTDGNDQAAAARSGQQLEKKRRQHHVWQHYLRAWQNEHGLVWCRMDSRTFSSATIGLGQERDFYELKEMSDHDVWCIEQGIIRLLPQEMQELVRGWIPLFTDVFEFRRAWEASGRRDTEIERALEVAINRAEEDAHAQVEGDAARFLAMLRSGDDRCIRLDADDSADLWFFLAMQYLRTRSTMQNVQSALEAIASLPRFRGFNAQASWGLLRWIFATTMGMSLNRHHRVMRVTFMDAPAGAELITGDQPIINTEAYGRAVGIEVASMKLYYPLSPTRGILFDLTGTEGETVRTSPSEMEVATFNHMIAEAADLQLYARDETTLLSVSRARRPTR
jgi:hypothetical protein